MNQLCCKHSTSTLSSSSRSTLLLPSTAKIHLSFLFLHSTEDANPVSFVPLFFVRVYLTRKIICYDKNMFSDGFAGLVSVFTAPFYATETRVRHKPIPIPAILTASRHSHRLVGARRSVNFKLEKRFFFGIDQFHIRSFFEQLEFVA